MDKDIYISVADAAEIIGVSKTAVSEAVRVGKIPGMLIGNSYVILRSGLSEYKPRNYPRKKKSDISSQVS